jgi:hypothetical protein
MFKELWEGISKYRPQIVYKGVLVTVTSISAHSDGTYEADIEYIIGREFG